MVFLAIFATGVLVFLVSLLIADSVSFIAGLKVLDGAVVVLALAALFSLFMATQ